MEAVGPWFKTLTVFVRVCDAPSSSVTLRVTSAGPGTVNWRVAGVPRVSNTPSLLKSQSVLTICPSTSVDVDVKVTFVKDTCGAVGANVNAAVGETLPPMSITWMSTCVRPRLSVTRRRIVLGPVAEKDLVICADVPSS